jgi:hypothetical protein
MADENLTARRAQLVLDLRTAATEIATAGHNGWGNLCIAAADEIESHIEVSTCACGKFRILYGHDYFDVGGFEFHRRDKCMLPNGPAIPAEDFKSEMLTTAKREEGGVSNG